jgi:hypothetical protein
MWEPLLPYQSSKTLRLPALLPRLPIQMPRHHHLQPPLPLLLQQQRQG